jgi:hypothetical protein
MTFDEIMNWLGECSVDKANWDYERFITDLTVSASFYVEPGRLIIVFPVSDFYVRFAIHTEDLEDFLLVPMW